MKLTAPLLALVAPLCSGLGYLVGVAVAAMVIVRTTVIGED